jgi:hypothetical protein
MGLLDRMRESWNERFRMGPHPPEEQAAADEDENEVIRQTYGSQTADESDTEGSDEESGPEEEGEGEAGEAEPPAGE